MQSLGPAAGTRPIPISPVFCCSIIFLSRPHAACGAIAGMPHAACMRSSRRKADMYDNMSERGRRRWRPSLPRSHFVAPAPIVHDGGRRARNRQMKWEFMPPLSLRSSPPLHSVLRTPPIWLSLTASLTHSPSRTGSPSPPRRPW